MDDNSKLSNERNLPQRIEEIDRRLGAHENAAADYELGYAHRILVQTLFPYRAKDADTLTRQVQNGPDRITITSTSGLPYGKYPRLIMAYIITRVVERQNLPLDEARRIPFGKSLNGFFNAIGIEGKASGGKRGQRATIKNQLDRLVNSSIKVESLIQTKKRSAGAGKTVDIASSYDLWFDLDNPDQQSILDSYIVLTEEFYTEILDHPIPIDMNILRKLGKPRAMDLYIWLSTRKYAFPNGTSYTWKDLESWFSARALTDWKQRQNFRNEIKKNLIAIEALWPEVGVTPTKEGITIAPGEPSIPKKLSKRKMAKLKIQEDRVEDPQRIK